MINACTACGTEAVVKVYLSHGCQAYNETIQNLCPQHLMSLTPVEDMEIIEYYRPEIAKMFLEE